MWAWCEEVPEKNQRFVVNTRTSMNAAGITLGLLATGLIAVVMVRAIVVARITSNAPESLTLLLLGLSLLVAGRLVRRHAPAAEDALAKPGLRVAPMNPAEIALK